MLVLTALRPRNPRHGSHQGVLRWQSPPEISILIPCLNEEAAVGDVVDEAWEGIHSSGRIGEVIVIDTASTDRSAEIAAEHVGLVIEGTDVRRQNVLSAFWWGSTCSTIAASSSADTLSRLERAGRVACV